MQFQRCNKKKNTKKSFKKYRCNFWNTVLCTKNCLLLILNVLNLNLKLNFNFMSKEIIYLLHTFLLLNMIKHIFTHNALFD